MARYQYETSPRKLQNDYEYKKSNKKNRYTSNQSNKVKLHEKNNKKSHYKVIGYVIVGFAVLFAISYRNSVINENFSQIRGLKSSLAALQKENEQLQVNIEDNLNLKAVEQSAQELLGMQKLDNSQKIYVSLPKQDYIEPASEEIVKDDESNGLFDKILNYILGK